MSSGSNKELFGDITGTEKPAGAQISGSNRVRNTGYIDQRGNAIADLASGAVEDKTYLWVDPNECRMWEHHNRQYDLLDEKKCADLIEGFKAQGRQENPSIVRPVKDGDDVKYEVICGARRHWTVKWLRANNYANFKYLIDVRSLTDEEAFRLSDLENREREDISDYERALDYKKAIKLYYGGIQSRMAERIGYTDANLSYLLKLADMPREIVDAYLDITQIAIAHGRDLTPLLKDRKSKAKILARANEIAELQQVAKREGKKLLDGKTVIRELKTAAKKMKINPNKPLGTYQSKVGKVILEVTKAPKQTLNFKLFRGSGASREEIREAFVHALEEHYSE